MTLRQKTLTATAAAAAAATLPIVGCATARIVLFGSLAALEQHHTRLTAIVGAT